MITLTGEHEKNLREWIANGDYCFLCDCHPSHGHDVDCPLYEVDIETETEIAIDNGILNFEAE